MKTVAVQARATWRLNTSREDFRFSLVLLVEREKYNSLTSSLRGLDDFLSPLVRDLGLEPRSQLRRRIYCPFFLAVSVFRTKTHFCSVPVRLPFRQSTHIYKPDKFADLRHTLHNLQPYSISRETRSEHWVATPILPAPVVPSIANGWRFYPTKSYAGLVYLQLSPAIQNCYIISIIYQ